MLKSLGLKVLVGAVLFVALVFGAERACRLSDDNAKLKATIQIDAAEIERLGQVTAHAQALFDQTVAAKDNEIAMLQGQADSLATQVEEGNADLKKLKANLASLNPAEKDAIIENQAAQIKILESNITLQAQQIVGYKAIIADWTTKYGVGINLNESLKAENVGLKKMVADQAALTAGLEKELKVARFWGTATKWTALALVAVSIFELIK